MSKGHHESVPAPGDAAPAVPLYEERAYHSASLHREQSYACMLPDGAIASGRRYPLLVLLHGHSGGFRDWAACTRIRKYLAGRNLIVVCPDGGNGWYTNGVAGGERREDDIMEDLLPAVERELPVLPAPARAVAGLSMGGFGAVKLALKHPGAFRIAASHSGAFAVTERPERSAIFGDPELHAAFRRREGIPWLAEQALCGPATLRPALVFDCGQSDPLLDDNRRLSDHLNFIGYGHTYREMPGYHTWPYWDRAFRTALPEIARAVGG
ncbi:MAG TPA: alpha/beta hydrolase family protein [Chthonomonadaceae bacterium]|nr:alpha/beta hydrolase family protein [Chthonomonadaceae bacterium]